MAGTAVAASIFNVLYSILLAVAVLAPLSESRTFGSGFSNTAVLVISIAPLAGIMWLVFAILHAVFIAKADTVFVAAAGGSPPRKLRGVHLGFNLAALAPMTGWFSLVGVPVTLVKLGNLVRERPKFAAQFRIVRWVGLGSVAAYLLIYVVMGILIGLRILIWLWWVPFLFFLAWVAVHVWFIVAADKLILQMIDTEPSAVQMAVAPTTPTSSSQCPRCHKLVAFTVPPLGAKKVQVVCTSCKCAVEFALDGPYSVEFESTRE